MEWEEDDDPEFLEPGPEVTRKLFLAWRSARRGETHAQNQSNPVWDWLVRSRVTAYGATDYFKGPCPIKAGPGWCCSRFGQSKTTLPDGCVVLIAGEHEDHYDADFYIYNDLIVWHPDGRIEIFGYPEEDFPPTDFHSATLVGDRIVLVGSLGYPDDRRPGSTQILLVELDTWKISAQEATGDSPGWIHSHRAELSEDGRSLTISGGVIDGGEEVGTLLENIDDWKLHLDDWRWERLTEKNWQQWQICREDESMNDLWDMRQALWNEELGLTLDSAELNFSKETRELLKEQYQPPPDPELFRSLYCPPLEHEKVPEREEGNEVTRIVVEGTTVRYVENMYEIMMTVEGDLPDETVAALISDLRDKLQRLEEVPYAVQRKR